MPAALHRAVLSHRREHVATVSYVEREGADPAVQALYDNLQQHMGGVPNIARALAHNPALARAFMGLNAAYGSTELDGKLRELAYLKTSETNGCAY